MRYANFLWVNSPTSQERAGQSRMRRDYKRRSYPLSRQQKTPCAGVPIECENFCNYKQSYKSYLPVDWFEEDALRADRSGQTSEFGDYRVELQ